MNSVELAKVKAFYWSKVVELGGEHQEARTFIQGRFSGGKWVGIDGPFYEPNWSLDEYRIKPETVMHQGGEIPKPLSESEASGIWCWLPNAGAEDNVSQILFTKDNQYLSGRLMKLGLLHSTKEAAMAHAKVIYQIKD